MSAMEPIMTRDELASFSSAALIDVTIQLTHRIHVLRQPVGLREFTQVADLREQRDAARAEILRRTGDAS